MFGLELSQLALVATFFIGYGLIIFEHQVKINKAAISLMVAVICWGVLFSHHAVTGEGLHTLLDSHLADISQIIFFLLGAMTIVELVDSHQGFSIITRLIKTRSKIKMMWTISILTFFMSSILDNLTTTIVMVSLLRKLVDERHDRWILGSLVVIAANAGGAWTPIGDVTTTMLWINGQLSTMVVMKALFIPSLISLLVSLTFQTFLNRKGNQQLELCEQETKKEPCGNLIFFVGVSTLIAVPALKILFHIPPFMGILVGLGFLWLITDLIHYKHQDRWHLRLPSVIQKVDVSSMLFFLGILLSISSLESAGILKDLANWVRIAVPSEEIVAAGIGIASAVVDNVPLVAACMGMYDVQTYVMDCQLWQMIAYCAGTGGSMLIIGSAAGVAFMGMEKVDFVWYLRYVSLTAAVGYFAGFGSYLLLNLL